MPCAGSFIPEIDFGQSISAGCTLNLPDPAEKTIVARIAENLEWSMQYFASDPSGSMNSLEETYRGDRAGFVAEAAKLLGDHTEHPGSVCVVAFLLRKDEILPLLSQPGTPMASRLRLAELAFRADPNLDQKLADHILSRTNPDQRRDLLEILSHTRVRAEAVNRLAPLLLDPSLTVRSKMAFLLARVDPEGGWVTEGLEDTDRRVRANVVEAMWNHKSEFAHRIFRRAALDEDHRVAANAIYGLYRLGDPEALGRIRHLLSERDGLARRSGLWLVEQTRDPRYLGLLAKLIGKVEPETRAHCLRAIQAGKSRKAEAMQRARVDIDLMQVEPGVARMTVTADRRLHQLHPFDVIVYHKAHVVEDFRMTERVGVAGRKILLLVGECPEWQRVWRNALPGGLTSSGDQFGVLHFQPAQDPQRPVKEAQAQLRGLDVVTELEQELLPADRGAEGAAWCGRTLSCLRHAFDHRPSAGLMTLSLAIPEAMRAVGTMEGGRQSGQAALGHIVVLDESGAAVGSRLLNELVSSGVQLDVISSVPGGGMVEYCQASGGTYQIAKSGADAALQLIELYRYWQADYQITFSPDLHDISVEVLTEWGYGFSSSPGVRTGAEIDQKGMVGVQGLEPRASSV